MSAPEQAKIKSSSPLLRVDDFSIPASMMGGSNIKPNSSDQIIGVKEGGIIAKKLDKMIELLNSSIGNGSGNKEIVLQINNRELARAVVGTMNNDLYNLRT